MKNHVLVFVVLFFFTSCSEPFTRGEERLHNDSLVQVEKQKKIDDARKKLSYFRKETNYYGDVNYYQDRRIPTHTNIDFIYPYIAETDNNYLLHIRFMYASNDIFKGIIIADGHKYTFLELITYWAERRDKDNDTENGGWIDIGANDTDIFILQKIANSKFAKIRYEGRQYYNDRTITSKEKSIIKKTLDIYNGLRKQ